ncbi:MAG: transglutaminase [Hyphomicrobiales bacterium]|nr:MAG: transglutaminase [Hyphomicrobiales bacterium]
MKLNITHRTEYHYDQPVAYALQQLRLTPKSSHGQKVLSWQTSVLGGHKEAEYQDQHDNHVELVSFDPGQETIVVACEGEVETADNAGVTGPHYGYAPLWFFRRPTPLTKPGPAIRKLARAADQTGDSAVAHLHALSAMIAEQVSYKVGTTHAETLAEEALNAGHGVCQDHAHIFLAAARLLGFPARYVSGYLLLDDTIEQDASHGWAEVHVDGLGWVGFDISNRISPDERYVRVASGLDYKDAAPISGMRFGDAGESMIVSLQVQQ